VPQTRIDGFDMYYERHGGAGDAVVLVHGYTGDVSDWREQVADLAPDHRVLAMDHRGHGRSGAPADRASYTIERMADDVEALIAGVGFDRFHLVGHSMGGMVAQEIALRRPERLLSLVLEDTGPEFPVARVDAVRKLFDARLEMAERDGMASVAMLPLGKPPPHHKPERIVEERARLSGMAVDGFAGGWQALCRWPGSKSRVAAFRTPTLVIHGELDAMVVPGSTWLAENIPGASLEVIPEAGHSPQIERPELFNAALRRHFARG
jgi:pimeloyl-ACP methyl ester carboxylesterase